MRRDPSSLLGLSLCKCANSQCVREWGGWIEGHRPLSVGSSYDQATREKMRKKGGTVLYLTLTEKEMVMEPALCDWRMSSVPSFARRCSSGNARSWAPSAAVRSRASLKENMVYIIGEQGAKKQIKYDRLMQFLSAAAQVEIFKAPNLHQPR